MIDETRLETMATQVGEIHALLFQAPRERKAWDAPRPTLLQRISDEVVARRRVTALEVAEALGANSESVRTALYTLRRRGLCARIGRGLWVSMYTGENEKPE